VPWRIVNIVTQFYASWSVGSERQSATNRYTPLARFFSFFFDVSMFLIRTAQQASWTAFPYSSVLQALRSTRRPHIQQNEAEPVLPSGVGVYP